MIYEYPELKVTEVNVFEEANRPTFEGALKKCKYESGGVPVLVIGEKCFQGYGDSMQQELRDAIEVDLDDAAKATAAENKAAMEKDADAFKTEHADRTNAISEYVVAAEPQKKTDGGSSIWFYVFLIALVAGLGFVLTGSGNKKK